MKLKYTMEIDDSLTHSLYMTSRSKKHKNRRLFSQIVLPVLSVGAGLFLNATAPSGNLVYLSAFLAIGLGWVIFQPFYFKYSIRKQCLLRLAKNFKYPDGAETELTIFGKKLEIVDPRAKGTVKFSDLHDIVEIPHYVFLRLKKGGSVIIPVQKLKEGDLEAFLEKVEKVGGIPRRKNLKWRWR